MTLILVFIFGLIIGSFLNAVIFRLFEGESFLYTRSRCPHCKHELAAWDLVPVFSFLFLAGRCRYCSKKISWQYPLVELLTAVTFVLFFLKSGMLVDSSLFFSFVFASFLIIIGIFDLKHYLILDKVIFPATVIAIGMNLYLGQSAFVSGLGGALTVSGFFALQYFISRGRWIGFGDVKLGLFLGNLLGFQLSVIMLALSYFSGALVGIVLIFLNRKKLSSKLPFGVFLSFSAIITMLYGQQIADWYLKLIGL